MKGGFCFDSDDGKCGRENGRHFSFYPLTLDSASASKGSPVTSSGK